MSEQHRPVIGISACLLGEQVRYDGGDKFQPLIKKQIAPFVKLIPFCPEVEAGQGIPRPPIQLVLAEDSTVRLQQVENPSVDVTDALLSVTNNFISTYTSLDGYIFKSRSPSCGLGSTPVQGEAVPGNGIFADALQKQFPQLLFIEESALDSEAACRDYLKQIHQRMNNDNY